MVLTSYVAFSGVMGKRRVNELSEMISNRLELRINAITRQNIEAISDLANRVHRLEGEIRELKDA